MNLNITTTEAKTRNHSVSTVAIAALIAGREVHDLDEALTAELAYEAAETFFAQAGVTSRETYLAHRAEVKSGLRQTAAEIRALKASLRQMDGNSQGFWQAQSELGQAVARVRRLHDTRVLGKAWSAAARRRNSTPVEAKMAG